MKVKQLIAIPKPVENIDYRIAISEGEIGIASGTRVKVCVGTGYLFNETDWTKTKLAELGLNKHGDPLRPYEKERPKAETTIGARTVHKRRQAHALDDAVSLDQLREEMRT